MQLDWFEEAANVRMLSAESVGDPMDLDGQEGTSEQLLDAWVAAGEQGDGEKRQEAARRIEAWIETGDVYAALDLGGLGLMQLPPTLPNNLRTLFVRANQLTSLEGAPSGLRTLDASSNRLTSLAGAPAGLNELQVNDNQITNFDGAPEELKILNLHSNRLTSLEGVPAGLAELYVNDNELTSLEGAPEGLIELRAEDNLLTNLLGAPADLAVLYINGNRLTNLEGIPAGLMELYVDDNELTSLEGVPAFLRNLDARSNHLRSLPEDLLTRLRPNCEVNLENNLLPVDLLAELAEILDAEDYDGPDVVLFTPAEGAAPEAPARPLHEAVANWLNDGPEAAVIWQGFGGEEGAVEYSRFLDRLRGMVSFRNTEFRQRMAADLRQAATRPRLREKFLLLAFSATERCDDRVILTWNRMQTARLADEVEDGAYDEKLGELIRVARRLFRLEALDRVAHAKIERLRIVYGDESDQIDRDEVYLAYQVKLRERLELQDVAPGMIFFDASQVTQDDLDAAVAQVREEEEAGFAAFLATEWQPWETVVRRIQPEAHAAMQEELAEAMEDEFQRRLYDRLAETALVGDADAEREFGRQIRDELAREIKGKLMRQVLRDKGLEILLTLPPPIE